MKKIFNNNYSLDESKFDYFIIWDNGRKFEKEILKTIDNKFTIIRLTRFRSVIFFYNLLKIYKYSFIPLHFLFKKIFYLLKYKNQFLAVKVINKKPNIQHHFNGIFRTYYCSKIMNMKLNIRKKYQKNSEEHIIHSTDTFHDYIAVNNVIDDNELSNFGNFKKKMKLNLSDLYCTQIYGSTFKNKYKILPLYESYQFKYLRNKDLNYEKYIEKFSGTSIRYYHSVQKFNELLLSIKKSNKLKQNIIVKKRFNKYVILDGLHRASIYLYLGKKYIEADYYE